MTVLELVFDQSNTTVHKFCESKIQMVRRRYGVFLHWQQCSTTLFLQIVEKPSDLDISEHLNSDEAEKTLIDRIKSIKQEK